MLGVTAAHLVITIHLVLPALYVQLVIIVLNMLGVQSHVERANVPLVVRWRLVVLVRPILVLPAQFVPVI